MPKDKLCNCRGNLNANNPNLPCSSCGGINPVMPKKDKRDWVKFHKALGDRLELFCGKRSCPICGYSPEILGKTIKKLMHRQKQEIVGEQISKIKDMPRIVNANKLYPDTIIKCFLDWYKKV